MYGKHNGLIPVGLHAHRDCTRLGRWRTLSISSRAHTYILAVMFAFLRPFLAMASGFRVDSKPPKPLPEHVITDIFDARANNSPMDVESIYGVLPKSSSNQPGKTRLQEIEDCKVVQLLHCKTSTSWQHEFVVALVRHHTNGDRVLCVERDSDYPDNLHASSRAKGKQKGGDGHPAQDTVKYYDTIDEALEAQGKTAQRLWQVDFSGEDCPNALHLFSAAYAIHMSHPDYTLDQYMCYWYAHHVIRVLAHERVYSVVVVGDRQPGSYCGIPVLDSVGGSQPKQLIDALLALSNSNTPPPIPASTLPNPPVFLSAGSFVPSEIVAHHHTIFLDVVGKLINAIEAAEAARAQEANDRVRDAEKRAEDEKKRADDEKKRADAFEKENAELRRQLMKLQQQGA